MGWIEFHIATHAEKLEALEYELHELGVEALTFQDLGDQPIFEPSAHTPRIWPETLVIALFSDTVDLSVIKRSLKNFHFEIQYLPDKDWQRTCLEYFKPIVVGKRLCICPSWHEVPDPNSINVILDPGLAFGTGTHPTTFLCLEWLEKHIKGDETLIDYGTGSGILGVSALKLGARSVTAVDIDPVALKVCQSVWQRNYIDSKEFFIKLPEEPLLPADIVIANILSQPLIDLAAHFADLTEPSGKIVLSGILKNQLNEVLSAYKPWFSFDSPPIYREEWLLLEGLNKNVIK